jgi:hypothetical protein
MNAKISASFGREPDGFFYKLVLLLEHRVFAVEDLELLDLARRSRGEGHGSGSTSDDAVAHLFAPPRQHEGMDVESIGHGLNLHARHAAQLHRRQLEFNAVAMHLSEAWLAHATPPSVS